MTNTLPRHSWLPAFRCQSTVSPLL